MGQVESSNIKHTPKRCHENPTKVVVSLICSIFSGVPIDWTNQFGLQRLGVTVFHCCRRMLWPGCRKLQNPLCKALIWDLIWSISDCSSWNLIWMLRTMNSYIWFEQSKLIPLFDESGTLSLPDHCLFWPDQRLDGSPSAISIGLSSSSQTWRAWKSTIYRRLSDLKFWNLHEFLVNFPLHALFIFAPVVFLVLAGRWAPVVSLFGPFWGDHFGTETIRMRWNDSGLTKIENIWYKTRHVSK